MKEYDINEVIRLRDEEKLQWKLIGEQIGVSSETLRKAYKRTKEGLTSHEANSNSVKLLKIRGITRKFKAISDRGGKCECCGYDKNIAAKNIKPSKEKLLELIKENSFLKVGEIVGTTENTIRKWCREYNLPGTKSELKEYLLNSLLVSAGTDKA